MTTDRPERVFDSLEDGECRARLRLDWTLYGTNYYTRNKDGSITVWDPSKMTRDVPHGPG